MREFWRLTWQQVGVGLIVVGGASSAVGSLIGMTRFAGAALTLTGGSSCIVGTILALIGFGSRRTDLPKDGWA